MCANATTTPTATLSPFASSTTSRSLLSRLTSPLKTRTRNLTDFHIKPDEPHRKYSPGDLVKGAVVLTVVKPVRLTHLVVCLHGFVRVFKNPNASNEPLPDLGLTPSSNPRKSQYFGNGHASLFQDEQTLCGEGRLDAGVYEFNFELEFPTKGLPTSIDFERGSISYMITATITRPTSITATSSCDQKISLVETVDVGPMVPPKVRTITLEPISRKSRRRKARSKDGAQEPTEHLGSNSEARTAAGSPLPDDSASQVGAMDQHAVPRSPVSSDIQSSVGANSSADSAVSSSTGLSFRLGPVPSSAKSTLDGKSNSKVSLADQTITATIELQKSGCLPGDTLPLKICIKHTKAMKSMHGIIITLYRQGRIDSAPPLSLFGDISSKEAERLKHEEYYPKSKTGLGGLSLSSAGSSSMFRKDLAQTFAPILVDPTTLTAEVNASVRVPEDAFPTVAGVPGQMISFKYQVEVVVDLGGKLAGQQRHVPRVGAVSLPQSFTNGPAGRGDGNSGMLSAWGGSIVDTENIRREKGVVACLFEVVVGTTDSARSRNRGNSFTRKQAWPEESGAHSLGAHEPIYEEPAMPGRGEQHYHHDQQPYPYYDHAYNDQQYHDYDEEYDFHEYYPDQHQQQYPSSHSQTPVPPPEVHREDGLGEKERLRRAEERLLPSQPPGESQAPSSSRTVIPPAGPSTPPIEHSEDLYSAGDDTLQVERSGASILTQSTSSNTPIAPSAPSAPALEDLHPTASANPSDDKQELERRRLIGEASAPSFPDEDENAGEGSSRVQIVPSAPILTDADEYGGHYGHHDLPSSSRNPNRVSEVLPKYER